MALHVEELYRTYGPMVLRRCRALLRNEERALDAMQDVFVQLLRKQEVLDQRAPSSLLYTVATNICLNILRKENRRAETADDEILLSIAAADDPEEQAVSGMFLDQLFSREPASSRVIAVLHHVDGMTLEETAQAVGMSVSGVRKRLRMLRSRGLALREV